MLALDWRYKEQIWELAAITLWGADALALDIINATWALSWLCWRWCVNGEARHISIQDGHAVGERDVGLEVDDVRNICHHSRGRARICMQESHPALGWDVMEEPSHMARIIAATEVMLHKQQARVSSHAACDPQKYW